MAPFSPPHPTPVPAEDFAAILSQRLEAWREAGLERRIRWLDSPQGTQVEVDGKNCLNFASNDYLGLANHPRLKEAAAQALDRYGAGAGASRLICGSLGPHRELEEVLAQFKTSEAALTFASGYAAALGTLPALMGKEDVVIVDRLVHGCILDAARLSGAQLRVFRHNDLDDLQRILRWAVRKTAGSSFENNAAPPARGRILIVTESVFSMDGDQAPLREMVALKEQHGAWLMVDEAHATGLYGANRRGLAETHAVQACIEIQMGTLGKAFGASGGYICGSRALIDYLIHRARTFLFSTAPVPAAVGAAVAGIELVQSAEGERRQKLLWERVDQARSFPGLDRMAQPSAILPWMIGKEREAVEMSAALFDEGCFVPAIRYPTVSRGRARLRIALSAEHTEAEVAALGAALQRLDRKRRRMAA